MANAFVHPAQHHTYLALWDAAGRALSCELPPAGDDDAMDDSGAERETIVYPNSDDDGSSHFQLSEMFQRFVETEFCPQTLFLKGNSGNYFAPSDNRHCHLASILLPFKGLFGVQGSNQNFGGHPHAQAVCRC